MRPGGKDDALGEREGVAALDWQARAVLAVGQCERERPRGRRKLRTETIALKLRVVSELAATNASGKAEKVLDQRRRSGLSTRRVALHNYSFESFGGGINRGGETGRTRPDDGEIASDFALLLARQRPEQPSDPRDFAQRRAPQRHSTRRDHDRQIATGHLQAFAQGAAVFALKVD